MKKISMLIMVIALVLVALAPATGNVAAQKFSSYTTGTQVMNMGGQDASVTLDYYSIDDGSANAGKVLATASDTIPANSSKTYFPTLTGFKGSMVVSSSQPTAAVTNIQNGTATASAAYVGASVGAKTVELPLLMKNNGGTPYDTWFNVQNTGGSNANISIKYTDCPSPITAVILPNASKSFSQASETCHTSKVFSGEITSDQPVVVVAVEENVAKMLAYTGFGADPGGISPNLVMPLVNANNSGITTGIQIQNTGGTETKVTLSYKHSLAGADCTETQTVPAHGSSTFALTAFSANNSGVTTTCAGGQTFVGSATVSENTAGTNLVGIVNQTKTTYGEAYGAFNPNNATAKVVMPLIMDRNGRNSYSTGYSVMNVGPAATFVKCTFTNRSETVTGTLAPNTALTPNQKGAFGVGYVGSSTCTAYTNESATTVDTSAKLVAVVNELGSTTADRLLVYEGINVAP